MSCMTIGERFEFQSVQVVCKYRLIVTAAFYCFPEVAALSSLCMVKGGFKPYPHNSQLEGKSHLKVT